MSFSPIKSHSDLLQASYEIGHFIHTFVYKTYNLSSTRPWSNYASYFEMGPNPHLVQTKRGLVLEVPNGTPHYLHTPFGKWNILGNCTGNWDKVMDAIAKPLGLLCISERYLKDYGEINPSWAITRWKDMQIALPEYRTLRTALPEKKVNAIWNQFAARHQDLRQKP